MKNIIPVVRPEEKFEIEMVSIPDRHKATHPVAKRPTTATAAGSGLGLCNDYLDYWPTLFSKILIITGRVRHSPIKSMSFITTKRLIAIITGASSGIGKATAEYFAEKGYNLSLNGRNEKALEATVNNCITKGLSKDSILTTMGDLTDEKVVNSLVERTMEKFGRTDSLINAAGILINGIIFGKVMDCSMQDYDYLMNVNLRSIVQLTRKVIPYLIKTKGSIVNVSSINGPCPVIKTSFQFSGVTFYCVSKAGLDQFTKCLALELGPEGVRFLDRATKFAALGKTGKAVDIARAIYFLASDKSSFITGDLLRVDGGRGIMHLR
uniref:Oxidoreductase n=1 Tax=Wuchereria bancrofti TaxID=6293 RepID=A0A1I8EBC7_WUCBA